MLEVVADRDVWRLNLELLPLQLSRTRAGSERRRMYRQVGHNTDLTFISTAQLYLMI